jgi:hypothetical protein
MPERNIAVFFYGLFMDMALLRQRGLSPLNPQAASLDGYDLEIGDRATLIPKKDQRVYGIVASLTHEEINSLYADPSVREYRPEAVVVTLGDGQSLPALCYNLPRLTGSERNTAYATNLLRLAKALALPEAYLEKLQRLAQE